MKEYHYRRTYQGGVQAVIFDWAGTTVDYGCYAPAVVFVEVFKRQGVTITMPQAREPMGMNKRAHIERITEDSAVAQAWVAKHGTPCTASDIDRMYEEFIPLQVECIASYADLIPGCTRVMSALRERNIKIGSTTGYGSEMMEVLMSAAKERGYTPDSMVCASHVPQGRPAPWMGFESARQLDVFPMEAIVNVDDTLPGIESGLNAGMWSIGVAKTGNEMGLTEAEIAKLSPTEMERRLTAITDRMYRTGAHYVIDGIADLMPCIEDIERRLQAGEKP